MDKNVQNILMAVGVKFKPVEFYQAPDKDFMPHNDSLLSRIKNKDSGYEYDTFYKNTVDELAEYIDFIRNQVTSSNELDCNIKGMLENFLEQVVTKGLCTQAEIDNEASLKAAAYQSHLLSDGVSVTPVSRTIINLYGEEMHANKEHIKVFIEAFKERLSKDKKYKNYLLDNDTESQIIYKARKGGHIETTEENELSFLLAMKEVLTNKYTMAANGRVIGTSKYGRAILFAALYVSILNSEGTRREKKRMEDSKWYSDAMAQTEDRYPTQEEMVAYLQNIPFEVSKIGSLFSLFPYGLIELLYLNKVGVFKEHAPAPINVAVMFSYPNGEPSEETKEQLVTAFLGREVEFMDGAIVGTTLRITEADRYRTSDTQKKLTAANIMDVKTRLGAVRAQELANAEFKQNVWRDGHTAGRVAYVTAYKQGIKLWIENYRMA